MTRLDPDKILAYCHIGKVGGKRFQFYLRSHFGTRCRCVARTRRPVYTKEELEIDLRWNPNIEYVGGHGVRPHVDYGAIGDRLLWFSLFRNPLTRILSHYYQQTVLRNFKADSVLDWLQKHPNRAYWQIYMISGGNNLAKAKDIVQNQYAFVGLNEHYEQSLFLFAKTFGLEGFRFIDGRLLPKPEKTGIHQEIREDFEDHKDDILELLEDEIDFYNFVKTVYDKQCVDYGKEKLDQELNLHFQNSRPLKKYNANNLASIIKDRIPLRTFAT